MTIRQIKYLNNIVEQDHRFIKKITKPMLGLKTFHAVKTTLSGIKLHCRLRKCQHKNTGVNNLFEQFYALAPQTRPGDLRHDVFKAGKLVTTEPVFP